MTVAAINRVNVQGTAEQQAQQIRSVMAIVFPEAVTLVREAREGLSSAAGSARGSPAVALGVALLAAAADDLLEAADLEDEHERGEPDAEA